MCVSRRVIERYYAHIQRNIASLCSIYGIKLMPLSLYLENGFTKEDFFISIGNEDGAASCCDGAYYIFYNDFQPHYRIRFTIAEELMHVLLGHTDDHRFQLGAQYQDVIYDQYEREAKLGASFILMPPKLYYTYRNFYNFKKLAWIFDMSEAAAYRAIKLYEREERTIKPQFDIDCPRYYPRCQPDINYRPRSVWAECEQ